MRAAEAGERRRWREIKRDLEIAPISTIHSFCAGLLREWCVEAALDPEFGVLDEMQTRALLRETVHEFILQRLTESDGMRQLVARLGLRSVGQALRKLLSERDRVDRVLKACNGTSRNRWEAALEAAQAALLERVTGSGAWTDALAVLEAHQASDADDKMEVNRRRILAEAAVVNDDGRPYPDRVAAWGALLSACRPNVGQHRKWPSKDVLAEVRAAVKRLGQLKAEEGDGSHLRPGAQDDMAAHLTDALIAEYGQAREAFSAAKRRRAVLDFSDLQILVRNLLADHPEVRAACQRRYRYVLVDEFQDTNELQKEIIWCIAGEPGAAEFPPPLARGKLFLVGDAKQSIYRFRDADVRVFNRTWEQFERTDGCVVHQLTRNFRSRRQLVQFHNDLFSRPEVMGTERGGRADFESWYTELEAEHGDLTDEPTPPVELLWARMATDDEPEEESAERDNLEKIREVEAWLIATRIKEMVANGEVRVQNPKEHEIGAGETLPPVRYGNIAILFRAMSDLYIYERGLRENDVPYYVVAGRGFYERQEIRDLLSVLHALENSQDEVALAGALRSPLFAVSDETLYWLCRRWRGRTWRGLYDRVCAARGEVPEELAHLDPAELTKVRRAAELLPRWRRVRHRVPIADLLHTVVQETGYLGALLTQFGGQQAAANVEKLIDVAREFGAGGLFSLNDFLTAMEEATLFEERESQAATQTEQEDVVQMMTIHKAKGLDWPVVIVPDLARGARAGQDGDVMLSPVYGPIVKGEDEDGALKWPAIGNEARRLEQEMELAERRRVFYVAATRARDRLILAASVKRRKEGTHARNTPLAWLSEALGLPCDAESRPLEGEEWQGMLTVRWVDNPRRPPRRKAAPYREHEQSVTAAEPVEPAGQEEEIESRVREVPIHLAGQRRFSVTELTTYLTCPQQYYYLYVERLPAYEPRELSEGRALTWAERGTIAHKALQRLGRHEGAAPEEIVAACLRELAPGTAAADDVRRELVAMMKRYRESDTYELVRHAARLKTEAPVAFQWGEALIEGRIDAAVYDQAGALTVVDFKTGELPRAGFGGCAELSAHGFQVGLYALGVREAEGKLPARLLVYYLDRAEAREHDPERTAQQAGELATRAISRIREAKFEAAGERCQECRHAWVCRVAAHG